MEQAERLGVRWADALSEIEGLLAELTDGADGYLVLNVDRADDPFVQFLASSRGLAVEAAATVAAAPGGRRRLRDQTAAVEMLSLGWLPPQVDPLRLAEPEGSCPNFHRRLVWTAGWAPALFSELAGRTLHRVWGVDPGQVRVRSARLASREVLSRC